MSEASADVVGQVGTNSVYDNGTNHGDIVRFTTELSEKYKTPFRMVGFTLVQLALNSVNFWPDWCGGVVCFLRPAGIYLV